MRKYIIAVLSVLLAISIVIISAGGFVMASQSHYDIDIPTQVNMYNLSKEDYSYLFQWPVTKDNVNKTVDFLDGTASDLISKIDIESMIFTDKFATMIAKITATLTQSEFTDLKFSAMKKQFPAAYEYVVAQQALGKTWDDIEAIPFGIVPGDKDTFVKAVGAGSQHFGDTLAVTLMVAPTSYNEGLIPLLEALHTGPMPHLFDFIKETGLSGDARMRYIAEKVITIIEPIKKAPVTYLCDFLPDLINSYNSIESYIASKELIGKYAKLHIPPLEVFMDDLLSDFNLKAPDFDFNTFTKMATAVVGQSGTTGSQRLELNGDRAVVALTMVEFIIDFITYENNFIEFEKLATGLLDIPEDVNSEFLSALESEDIFRIISSGVALFEAISQSEMIQQITSQQ